MTGGPSIKVVDATTKELTTMMQTLTDLHKEESTARAAAAREQQDSLNSLIALSKESHPQFTALLTHLQRDTPPPPDNSGASPSYTPDPVLDPTIKTPKIDFPTFDGDNPRRWIRRCERFFQLKSVPLRQRTQFASIHLVGKAESWFHDFQNGKDFIAWSDFYSSICECFEDLANENFVGCFNKLPQINSVEEYYEKIEPLKALMLQHNPFYTEDYFVMSFLSGLKVIIRLDVEMHKPTTLSQAYYLSRLREGALASQQQQITKSTPYKQPTTATYYNKYSQTPPISTPRPPTSSLTVTSPPPNTQPTKSLYVPPPIRRLSREEQDKRRAQGLCYNCDDKYTPDHRCKPQRLFMTLTDDETENTEPPPFDDASTDSLVESDMEISLHALTGTMSACTI
ncbi:uncharacterized protein LOC113326818 isoform X1 [Papaver somniferum]|uniref:uncharacterized protein LOC113326818 isoform X1 n=1 Tax=Papaver somniferum TaxID=3469 RepID=UPI000E6F7425|nr:uncharacterized protein LOC113326818 isoform X1 [Papaver somniferum]XP_026430272.1 uncharacterized protein LOC113326818 isoform X1 [Papaver somniferum]XP_026430273.1 uncharacterized protein LOC113326818 isoform X1 [Papaver somniferum]XP_026430274.1 uncharacterized protein LOC113326818 isoform X1 [Papaver somniferum]XP_026430275.1 uncharacterized protein LOC113326818 isoform X1 [Papaver somniferum]XP_026430276.1 uncharacterized protein LOC113326818 isoform X1 [Papaver somniferum]